MNLKRTLKNTLMGLTIAGSQLFGSAHPEENKLESEHASQRMKESISQMLENPPSLKIWKDPSQLDYYKPFPKNDDLKALKVTLPGKKQRKGHLIFGERVSFSKESLSLMKMGTKIGKLKLTETDPNHRNEVDLAEVMSNLVSYDLTTLPEDIISSVYRPGIVTDIFIGYSHPLTKRLSLVVAGGAGEGGARHTLGSDYFGLKTRVKGHRVFTELGLEYFPLEPIDLNKEPPKGLLGRVKKSKPFVRFSGGYVIDRTTIESRLSILDANLPLMDQTNKTYSTYILSEIGISTPAGKNRTLDLSIGKREGPGSYADATTISILARIKF